MQDYSKLIQALRCKRDDCEGCDLAFLDNDEGWMCQYAAKDADAAAAIEALQAEVKILKVSGREAYFEGLAADDNRRQVKELAKRNAELHAELEKWVSAAEGSQAEVDALKHDIERYVQMNTELINDRPELEEIGGKWVWKEPKRGEWITIRLNNGGSYTGCSCCEAPIPTDTMLDYIPESESKYCYSCGAKMEVQDG